MSNEEYEEFTARLEAELFDALTEDSQEANHA